MKDCFSFPVKFSCNNGNVFRLYPSIFVTMSTQIVFQKHSVWLQKSIPMLRCPPNQARVPLFYLASILLSATWCPRLSRNLKQHPLISLPRESIELPLDILYLFVDKMHLELFTFEMINAWGGSQTAGVGLHLKKICAWRAAAAAHTC